ncbi:MAG: type II toxin-antitoxin system Phd/YefM family antitoxin, partial [bacterium]|nr:type II toxin-antitoxin system Phd/YefM family antitoxin [bacterium]
QIIEKNGKKEYAVLPYTDYLKLREELEDYDDLRCLRSAKAAENDAPTIGLNELKKKLFIRVKRTVG